ncbi:MAG: HypC/HybG/HupF family hydrogenase formation chaperone [Acidimicrobiia bacterium]|jgi:hydrogenase expression/formation protein HypC
MCVAVPCRIESIVSGDGPSRPARVSLPDGSIADVDLMMVPDADVGDYVITHSGYAISRVAESSASATLGLLSAANEGEKRHELGGRR